MVDSRAVRLSMIFIDATSLVAVLDFRHDPLREHAHITAVYSHDAHIPACNHSRRTMPVCFIQPSRVADAIPCVYGSSTGNELHVQPRERISLATCWALISSQQHKDPGA